jgi:hypothetical protein
MTQRIRFLTAALGALFVTLLPGYAQAPREWQLFDDGWRFHLGDVSQGQSTTLADKDWRFVDLPHDWSIEGPFDPKNASGTGFCPAELAGIGRRSRCRFPCVDRKFPSVSMAYIATARCGSTARSWVPGRMDIPPLSTT